jgi:S1-C subfamily serine protease
MSSLYNLPEFNFSRLKKPFCKFKFHKSREKEFPKFWKSKKFIIIFCAILILLAGVVGGIFASGYWWPEIKTAFSKINIQLPSNETHQIVQPVKELTQEEKVINIVKKYSPAVVSIIIMQDVPVYEAYYSNPFGISGMEILQYRENGTEKEEIGQGTGFIISSDGLILTNKHVVSYDNAEYTVLTNDGEKYTAEVLALDPSQDLAIIKINGLEEGKDLPFVKLGDSDNLQIGQTVITIGNSLGELSNTVSVGVISGLSRTITASGAGLYEIIEGVIQTDAAINSGNSGGPLINLNGEVIGINTATVTDAQSIGFSIPINKAKKDIEQITTIGKISYPFLGIRYITINDKIQAENDLQVNYGAWIRKGSDDEPGIVLGSPAEAAGLEEGDIILEFNGEKISEDNTLTGIISKYSVGDTVMLKFLSSSEEKTVTVTLAEFKL